jgi:hypothetical protein
MANPLLLLLMAIMEAAVFTVNTVASERLLGNKA